MLFSGDLPKTLSLDAASNVSMMKKVNKNTKITAAAMAIAAMSSMLYLKEPDGSARQGYPSFWSQGDPQHDAKNKNCPDHDDQKSPYRAR